MQQQQQVPNPAVASLPTDLKLRVLSLLPRNYRVLSGRLVCRDLWVAFDGDPTASLAEPLPPHAAPWACSWAQGPGQVPLREMPYDGKLHLLCTAAASGSEVNLEVVWTLLQPSILPELLQSRVFVFASDPGLAAARAGHVHLLSWLVRHCPALLRPISNVEAAAKHCSLVDLQAAWEALHGETAVFLPVITQGMLDAAAGSATPDSIAKVEWVLATGPGRCRLQDSTVQAAARSGDVGLMRWLQGQGCTLSTSTVLCALSHADLAVVQWLVDEAGCGLPALGGGDTAGDSADDANSESGDSEDGWDDGTMHDRRWVPYQYAALRSKDGLAKLDWLHERGCPLFDDTDILLSKLHAAVDAGQEEAARYLLSLLATRDAFQGGAEGEGSLDRLAAAALAQGSIPIVQLLCEAGCVLGSWSFRLMARPGNVAMVRWLVREAGVSAADMDQTAIQMLVKEWPCKTHEDGCGLVEGMQLLLEAGLALNNADWGPYIMQRMLYKAAETGNLAVVQEFLGQVDADTARLAVHSGCEALVEWVAGLPGGVDCLRSGSPYVDAVWRGDMGTVAVLRRLGVQWGLKDVVARAVEKQCGPPAVRWLVEQGAPVGSREEMEGALRFAAPWFSGEDVAWLRGVAGAAA